MGPWGLSRIDWKTRNILRVPPVRSQALSSIPHSHELSSRLFIVMIIRQYHDKPVYVIVLAVFLEYESSLRASINPFRIIASISGSLILLVLYTGVLLSASYELRGDIVSIRWQPILSNLHHRHHSSPSPIFLHHRVSASPLSARPHASLAWLP
jgi:hypothetical protein